MLGTRLLWVSGGVHYARHTPELWPVVMKRAKQAGLTGITTYVFWNLHERFKGVYDWGTVEPRANVTRFLQASPFAV